MRPIWRRHTKQDEEQASGSNPGTDGASDLRVSRTLVKSEPEVEQLISSDPRLSAEGIEVTMAGKGFGTRVAIVARPPSGLAHGDLERLLDELAEPQKRPFSNA